MQTKALPFTIPSVEHSSFLIQEDRLEGFYPYLHRHEEIQICWIRRGRGTLIVQAEVYEFQQGDIFVIASNKAHLFKNAKTENGIEAVSLFFGIKKEGSQLWNIPELAHLYDSYQLISPCNQVRSENLTIIQSQLLRLLKIHKTEKLICFLELLNKLLPHLKIDDNAAIPYSEKDGDRMKEIITYTLNHFHEEISVRKMANLIGYSPEAFCRFFKKRTNKTFIQYLNELRINEVCRRLLAESGSNVSQIAYESGFNNISHFNRVFKNIKGISPLALKKNLNI